MPQLWRQMKNFLRRNGGGPGEQVMVLRDLSTAQRIPRRAKQRGPRRGALSRCRCGAPLHEVLFTTGTQAGDPQVWRVWPLAVDGWRCAKCGNIQLARFLEPEETVAIGKSAAKAAQEGRFDEAELGFRRILGSWPAYAPGLADLASALMLRARKLDLDGKTDLPLLEEVEALLSEALALAPPPPRPHLVETLARALLLREQAARARDLLDEELARPGLPSEERQQLERTARWVNLRGDLFERGSALVPAQVMTLHGQPAPVLDAAGRARVERGIESLLQHLLANSSSWQALWIAAMGTRTIDGAAAAIDFFARAHALAPDRPDVGREYVLSLLTTGEFARAVEVASRIAHAHPEDAGLTCNLSLAQLLAGDLDGAAISAEQAVSRDPSDVINQKVRRLIAKVRSGAVSLPSSLAELEAAAQPV